MKKTEKIVIKEQDIERREWRFGMHLPTGPSGQDLHLIKEVVTLKDKTKHAHMRVLPNYERPIWMTKMQYRTHVDTKEYEHISKLDKIMVRQSDLRNKVAMLTGNPTSSKSLSELLVSPFIYGADVPSTTVIHRNEYQKPNEGLTPTPYKVGAFDTETDVVHGHGEIIIGSMTILPYVHLVINSEWLQSGSSNVGEEIQRVIKDKIEPVMTHFYTEMDKIGKGHLYPKEERELIITHEIVNSEIEIVEKSFQWFHERMPDYMAIWNIDFDVKKVLDACKRANVDPKMVLCDQRIPPEYRICKYKPATQFKVAASGKGKPVSPHDQWNVLFLTASFFPIDSMSSYRLLRLGEQEERSYSLDAILEKELGGAIQKLKHPPADMYVKEKWHQVMQSMHKLVYIAYAAVDTISMCLLDRFTRDLSHRLPAMADITDLTQCNSQPKRLRDAFYVFAHDDHDSILGSVGHLREYKKADPEPEEDLGDTQDMELDVDEDEEEELAVLGRKGWVLTLASHLSAPGLKLLEETPNAHTGIRAFVYDSDAVSSYPSCTQVGNVSKVTTRKEVAKIGDFEEKVFKMQNINLLAGPVNAIEYTTTMFKAPNLFEMLDIFDTKQVA